MRNRNFKGPEAKAFEFMLGLLAIIIIGLIAVHADVDSRSAAEEIEVVE